MEILGHICNSDGVNTDHIENRIRKCRGSYYMLNGIGMSYPGAASDVKSYMWKAICAPTLLYGTEAMYFNGGNIQKLNSLQGTLVKNSMGLGKRSLHSNLLSALHIKPCAEAIKDRTLSLFNRVFKVESPLRRLCTHMMANYVQTGTYNRKTLLGRVINFGESVLNLAFCHSRPGTTRVYTDNGTVDSLKVLIMHENFIKPYSEEHILTRLLTRAF
jgi:hypothetical protein